MARSITKSATERHISIPLTVMRSEDYRNLSGSAVKLLNAMLYQYHGYNNGDLTVAWSVMYKQHGFRSKETLTRAKDELLKARLITMTRVSLFQNPNNKCALYAITWRAIDECPGKHLDVKATRLPARKFSMEETNYPARKPYPARPGNRTGENSSDPETGCSKNPSATKTGAETFLPVPEIRTPYKLPMDTVIETPPHVNQLGGQGPVR